MRDTGLSCFDRTWSSHLDSADCCHSILLCGGRDMVGNMLVEGKGSPSGQPYINGVCTNILHTSQITSITPLAVRGRVVRNLGIACPVPIFDFHSPLVVLCTSHGVVPRTLTTDSSQAVLPPRLRLSPASASRLQLQSQHRPCSCSHRLARSHPWPLPSQSTDSR